MLQIMSLLRGAKNLLAPWNKTIGFEAKRIPLGLDLSGSFEQIFHCVQDDTDHLNRYFTPFRMKINEKQQKPKQLFHCFGFS